MCCFSSFVYLYYTKLPYRGQGIGRFPCSSPVKAIPSTPEYGGINRRQEPLNIVWINIPYVADSEGIGDTDFAGVDDEAVGFQGVVEPFEVVVGLVGVEKRGNDRGLVRFCQQTLEAQPVHAFYQHPVVFAVPGVPGVHAAFVA